MAKRIDISKAMKSSDSEKKEIQCIMFPEEFHFWSLKNQWKQDRFKKNQVSLAAVEVYGTSITENIASIHKVTKSAAIILDCGVEIFSGRHGMTGQSNLAQFKFRVSGVSEFNQAMKELSAKFDFNIWTVVSAEIFYPKMGATLYFWRHNPNGIGTQLYLGRVVTVDFDKPFESISILDQQAYSNGFYDVFASCSLSWEPSLKKNCAILKRKEINAYKKNSQQMSA